MIRNCYKSCKKFCLIAAILFSVLLTAQNRQKLDSLYSLQRTTKNDTVRVNLLNTICQEYLVSEPEVALDYANQALDLASRLEYHEGQAYSCRNIALYYYSHNAFDLALKNHSQALEIFEKLNDREGMLLSYNSLGLIYYRQGYYPLAIRNYLSVLTILEEIGDKVAIANNYSNIAKIYYKDGNFALALDYLQSALKI